jgi:hypothetical protein
VPDVLDRTVGPPAPSTLPVPDERAARRTLLDQIARLGGARLLSLGELEELRDDLADRVADSRRALSDRTWVEEQNRRLIEQMLLAPERYKWVRVSHEDIGEPGCRHWHVRPRWSFIGMLMGWWRVVISSGCPLAT